MAWHCGQPLSEVETIPVGTLEFRKRTRSNAADTKDVDVVLSPQRMSFGNGCAGSKVPPASSADISNSNNKRLNGLLPKTSKFDKNSERTRDPDREKHLQKLNGYSGNREQIRKAIRDLHENRDRNKDGKVSLTSSKLSWFTGGLFVFQSTIQMSVSVSITSAHVHGKSQARASSLFQVLSHTQPRLHLPTQAF